MKKITLSLLSAVVLSATATAQTTAKQYKAITPDTANSAYTIKPSTKVRYIHSATPEDAYIFHSELQKNRWSSESHQARLNGRVATEVNEVNTIYVNEEVTTHIIMPENIKLVDISTAKIVGNQCADNIVRLKPANRMYDRELAGTITVIGERHIAQFNVVYTKGPAKANSVYNVTQDDMRQYTNPDVSMTYGDMSRLSWSIFTSRRKKFGIKSSLYGIKAQVNNVYTVGDYFFIDFSLKNQSKIKYDIAEIRLKLMDKKELKATNSQTIELTPVYMLNHAKSFQKEYRNVIVLKKLTFPNEKKLRLEISEDQISGRISYIDINYRDILNADSFSSDLLINLH